MSRAGNRYKGVVVKCYFYFINSLTMYIYLFSLLTAFSVVGGWVEYENKQANFKISHPEGWTVTEEQSLWMFLAPKEGADDDFQENVNFIIQDISSQPMTLDEFTKLSIDQYSSMPEVVQVLSVKDATLASQKAKVVLLTMQYLGMDLKLKQYWFVKKNVAFLLTFTARQSTFDRYEADGTKVMESFRFIK